MMHRDIDFLYWAFLRFNAPMKEIKYKSYNNELYNFLHKYMEIK